MGDPSGCWLLAATPLYTAPQPHREASVHTSSLCVALLSVIPDSRKERVMPTGQSENTDQRLWRCGSSLWALIQHCNGLRDQRRGCYQQAQQALGLPDGHNVAEPKTMQEQQEQQEHSPPAAGGSWFSSTTVCFKPPLCSLNCQLYLKKSEGGREVGG